MKTIPNGIWPTMLTPFTDANHIDYHALEHLIEWYIDNKATGLFAVCQSSEMFYLNFEERVKLAGFVTKIVNGRIPVIASGHTADLLDEQIEEIRQIVGTGIDAFVILSNRLASADEPDTVWKDNAERILNLFPDVKMGIYEAPYPYKRLVSPELLRWCADTGRFLFLKDTSCDIRNMEAKLNVIRNSNLKLFNANSATLLATLRLGAAGYSGVMSNFFPDLYGYLVENWVKNPEMAETVQNFIGTASLVERQRYPVNAKYYLQKVGLPITLHTRSRDEREFNPVEKMEIDQLTMTFQLFRERVTHGFKMSQD
jgi:4-hydroxy-tetrahydrodipicolinate synthase